MWPFAPFSSSPDIHRRRVGCAAGGLVVLAAVHLVGPNLDGPAGTRVITRPVVMRVPSARRESFRRRTAVHVRASAVAARLVEHVLLPSGTRVGASHQTPAGWTALAAVRPMALVDLDLDDTRRVTVIFRVGKRGADFAVSRGGEGFAVFGVLGVMGYGPDKEATKAELGGAFRLHFESVGIVKRHPLIAAPFQCLHGCLGVALGLNFGLVHNVVDLRVEKHTDRPTAGAGVASCNPGTACVHAGGAGGGKGAAIEGDSQVDHFKVSSQ